MRGAAKDDGFSLVEVMIAVAVFAIAVAAVLALLPSLTRQAASSAEQLAAQRLGDGIRVELQRLVAERGLDALADEIPAMSGTLQDGFALVASRDGDRVGAMRSGVVAVGTSERFFLVELWRFRSPPLAYEAGGAVLPVWARVSWPYQLSGAAMPTAEYDRSSRTFAIAVRR